MSGMDFDKEIAQIYRDMELYLIESMQRNLAGHLAEEAKTGFSYPQWQAEKLKELKRYQRENRKIVRSQTEGLSEKVAKHMKSELRQGSKHELKRYREALGKGYKPATVMRKSFFKVNDRKVSGMINALQNDLGAANTAVLRMMNDTYRQTIFRAGMYASNGVMTETQAYDMAVKDFLNRGINCIEYRDGRRVNIADYASMAVRTANQRAYMVGEGEFRKSIGETLVIISHHASACKLCRPFERKVLIDDVYSGGKPDDGDYMLLSEAMKLGLFHPRCRHELGTYYPELEEINHYNNEENDVSDYGRYNRAHIENMVQRYKRLTVGSVDPENVARYQAKLKEWEKESKQFQLKKQRETDIINKRKRISQFSASQIIDKVNNGDYSLTLSAQQFFKHIEGTKQFESYKKTRLEKGGNPQSVLLVDKEKAQEIIKNRAGTGIIRSDRKGEPRPVEDINCHFVVGKYFGNGKYHETTKAAIHYGKKRSHLVPIRGDDFD